MFSPTSTVTLTSPRLHLHFMETRWTGNYYAVVLPSWCRVCCPRGPQTTDGSYMFKAAGE